MKLHVQMQVATAVRPSQRVLQTAAMFGLGVDEQRTMQIVPPVELHLPSGGVVFITGPSGGGKSTMLALIAQRAQILDHPVLRLDQLPELPDAPLVDCFGRPLQDTMELLGLVGLSDAFVMLRRPSELSDGQRARLRLAQAIELASHRAPADPEIEHGGHRKHGGRKESPSRHSRANEKGLTARDELDTSSPPPLRDLRVQSPEVERCGAIIIADEFAATLDRLTARNLAASLRRWVSRTPHCLVLATTHDDLLEPLSPDVLIVKGLGEHVEVHEKSKGRRVDKSKGAPPRGGGLELDFSTFERSDVSLQPATLRDYQALARFHYRQGRPGVVTGGFKLVHGAPTVVGRYLQRREETQIVAVLLRSLPHLGCALRDLAVRGRYRGLSRREAAMLLNREVRTISRVVIDPRWRGLGLAGALVRHALTNPEPGIVLTEALATMGQVHPFFEKAGMTRYQRPPRPPHARLGDALAQLAIPLETLASLRAMRASISVLDELAQNWLQHELRRFAQATRGRGGGGPRLALLDELIRHARQQLLSAPVYYAFVHCSPSPFEGEGRGEGGLARSAPRGFSASAAGKPARFRG